MARQVQYRAKRPGRRFNSIHHRKIEAAPHPMKAKRTLTSLTKEVGRFIETPTSSRHVIGGHAFAYFCKLCRAEMPFEQRESHNRAIHPNLLERQRRAHARNMRIVITAVVGSGAGFFLGLFVPAAILGAMFAGFFVPLPFVAKARRIYFEDVGSILVPCVICSAKIGERELRSHFASVHPEEFTHFRSSFWMVRISPNGILLYGILAATFLSLLGLGVWVWLPFAAWVGLFLLWAVLARRHWQKARGAWRATHALGSLPRQ